MAKALAHLEAGDWQAAHEIVQTDEESALACWAHGIVHLMEGDVPNARYWYREAKRLFPSEPSAAAEISALKAQITGEE
jgi:Flp pilus assembly protein TadD